MPGSPACASTGSVAFLAPAASPSSSSEQSIPSLGTPPISRAVSVIPSAGSTVPIGASATCPPGSGTLGAPQTMRCNTPAPRSTVTSRSFAREGCGSTARTSAMTTALLAPYSAIPSTASPARENRSASSVGEASRSGTSARIQR